MLSKISLHLLLQYYPCLGIMTIVDLYVLRIITLILEVKKMPQIESAIKRVRTNEAASARNSSQVSAMRTAIKKAEQAAEAGAENADALYKDAIKAIDMTESKGLIHANKANRDKSRLSKRVSK